MRLCWLSALTPLPWCNLFSVQLQMGQSLRTILEDHYKPHWPYFELTECKNLISNGRWLMIDVIKLTAFSYPQGERGVDNIWPVNKIRPNQVYCLGPHKEGNSCIVWPRSVFAKIIQSRGVSLGVLLMLYSKMELILWSQQTLLWSAQNKLVANPHDLSPAHVCIIFVTLDCERDVLIDMF